MKKALLLIVCCCNFMFAQEKLAHVVYFETDKHEVPAIEENRLLLFISTLDTVRIKQISIYGFCDDRGSDNYNLKLSQKRANAIKTIFSNNELDESLISNVDGKGEVLLKIVQEKDIEKIRGYNRKVEIIVTKKNPPKKEVIVKNTTHKKSNEKTTEDIVNNNVKKGDKIRLEKIYFKTGYSYLIPESREKLDEIAEILIEQDHLYFTVQGHVCCTQNSRDAIDRKTKKRNLSLARAKTVYEYLAKKGVNKKRMKYVGLRRKFPLGGDYNLDRRVEIQITYVGEKT